MPYSAWISPMLQPANFSISRLSSTKVTQVVGQHLASVDLPAPRKPTSATRELRCAGVRRCAAGAEHLAHGHAHAAQRGVVAVLQQLAEQQPIRATWW